MSGPIGFFLIEEGGTKTGSRLQLLLVGNFWSEYILIHYDLNRSRIGRTTGPVSRLLKGMGAGLKQDAAGASVCVNKRGCYVQSGRPGFSKPPARLEVAKSASLGGQGLTFDLPLPSLSFERPPLEGHGVAAGQVFNTTRC